MAASSRQPTGECGLCAAGKRFSTCLGYGTDTGLGQMVAQAKGNFAVITESAVYAPAWRQ